LQKQFEKLLHIQSTPSNMEITSDAHFVTAK